MYAKGGPYQYMDNLPNEKDLSHKNLRGADLSKADLSSSNLEYANLAGANLKHARLTNANLLGVNLEGADLEGAILQGADFRRANLRRANLSKTYSMWTDFRGADLEEADLQGAIVEGARFEEASLENTNLLGISYNRATSWPEGFAPASRVSTVSQDRVATIGDLIGFMFALASSYAIDYQNSLEEYLRALWILIDKYQKEPVTARLLARLFAEAFWQDLGAFDEEWRRNPAILYDTDLDGDYEYLQHALITQIVELNNASKGPQEKGLISNWSNLKVEDYLAAAAGGFQAHSRKTTAKVKRTSDSWREIGRSLESTECIWRDFADMLELGKSYE